MSDGEPWLAPFASVFHWGAMNLLQTGVRPRLLISVVRMTVPLDALVVEPLMVFPVTCPRARPRPPRARRSPRSPGAARAVRPGRAPSAASTRAGREAARRRNEHER